MLDFKISENLKNNLKVTLSREIGKSHIRDNKPCQDFGKYYNISKDIDLVTLSDGHGNPKYKYSDIGSYLACETFYKLIISFFDLKNNYSNLEYLKKDEFKQLFIDAWKNEIIKDYNEKIKEKIEKEIPDEEKIKLYGTTFLFCIILKDSYVIGHIGDGMIMLFNDQKLSMSFKRHLVKKNSKTSSLIQTNAIDKFQIDIIDRKNFSNILMTTDGIYDVFKRKKAFLEYGFNLRQKSKENLLDENIFVVDDIILNEETDDDCTIALIESSSDSKKYTLDFIEDIDKYNITFNRVYNGLQRFEIIKKDNKENNQGKDQIYIIDIFENYKKNKNYIIDKNYINDNNMVNTNEENGFKLIFPIFLKDVKNDLVYFYDKSLINNMISLKHFFELFLNEERRYIFENLKIEEEIQEYIEENDMDKIDYYFNPSNQLKIFNNLLKLKEFLIKNKLNLHMSILENIFIDEYCNIYILAGSIYQPRKILQKNIDDINKIFDTILNKFKFIASIKINENEYPLYKIPNYRVNKNGQIILIDNEVLGYLIFNNNKNIYGFINKSKYDWIINFANKENEIKQIIVKPNQIIPLTRDVKVELKDTDKSFEISLISAN